jgi:hypothetical protein
MIGNIEKIIFNLNLISGKNIKVIRNVNARKNYKLKMLYKRFN